MKQGKEHTHKEHEGCHHHHECTNPTEHKHTFEHTCAPGSCESEADEECFECECEIGSKK